MLLARRKLEESPGSTCAKPSPRTLLRFRGRLFLAGLALSLVPANWLFQRSNRASGSSTTTSRAARNYLHGVCAMWPPSVWRAGRNFARSRSARRAEYPAGLLMHAGSEVGGDLRFTQSLTEYCAVVTVRDIPDDRELRSAPTWWKPGPMEVWDETIIVAGCPEPPTPSLLPFWCCSRASAGSHARCSGGCGRLGALRAPTLARFRSKRGYGRCASLGRAFRPRVGSDRSRPCRLARGHNRC